MEKQKNNAYALMNLNAKKMVPYIVIALVTAATFAGSLRLPFLSDWDDVDHIVGNSHLAFSLENIVYWFSHDVVLVYMPFTMLSYMFDYALWGLNPIGYRLTALLLHIIAAWGVYKCFRYFKIGAVVAVMFSLLFAIHPQRIESVVWMSERKDVLCAAFYFWSVFFYMRGVDRGWKSRIPAFLLFGGALLSKPMAVSLPFVFLCIEFNYRRDFKVMYYLKRIGPFMFGAGAMMVVTLLTQKVVSDGGTDFVRQAAVIVHNVYWYVVTMFVPAGLMPIYPRVYFDLPLICRMGLFYLMVILVLYKLGMTVGRKKMIFEVFPLIAATLFSLAPVVGIFSIGNTDYADRYFYMPSAFVILMIVLGGKMVLSATPDFKITLQKAGCVIFVLIAGWCIWYDQSLYKNWNGSYAVVKSSVQTEYCNEMALFSLGIHCYKNGYYSELAEIVVRLRDYEKLERYRNKKAEIRANYLMNEGKLYYISGNIKAASESFSKVLKIIKSNAMKQVIVEQKIIEELYGIEMKIGNTAAASELIDAYLANCDKYHLHNRWSSNFMGMKAVFNGNYAEAAAIFKRILDKYPDDKVAAGNYLRALQMLEKKQK